MNKKWSGLESGWIVELKFVSKDETSDTDYDQFIIATADSIDCLKSIAETNCDSNIELVNKWSNLYDLAIEY